MNSQHQTLFNRITQELDSRVGEDFIKSTKTEKGNTQVSERVVIEKIREILTSMGLTFEEAGSQQSKDFRNVGGIGLNIEIKKTDNPTVYFNDTCPSKDIWYIIFFTGKEYKRKTENNIPAKLLYINGEEFIKDSPWLEEYIKDITALKDKYARGQSKKLLAGIMEVYPRPTFKANITRFLKPEAVVIDEVKEPEKEEAKEEAKDKPSAEGDEDGNNEPSADEEEGIGCNNCYSCVTGGSRPCETEIEKEKEKKMEIYIEKYMETYMKNK